MDCFINPLSQTQPSYLKDTKDFLSQIRKIQVPQNSYLIAMDVCSLDTSISHDGGIKAVKEILENTHEPMRPDWEILQLNNNDFEFNEKFFSSEILLQYVKEIFPKLCWYFSGKTGI